MIIFVHFNLEKQSELPPRRLVLVVTAGGVMIPIDRAGIYRIIPGCFLGGFLLQFVVDVFDFFLLRILKSKYTLVRLSIFIIVFLP